MTTVIRCPKGTNRRVVDVESIQVPDLWHIGLWLEENEPKDLHNHLDGQTHSQAVLECWHLCHDLLENLINPDC